MSRESNAKSAFADARNAHGLLDGFAWRLAQHPDADGFALRGGMAVRHWFPGEGRLASDVDLVCTLPYDLNAMRSRLHDVLSTEAHDGIELDHERFRLDAIWPDDAHPGMRLFVQATLDGEFDELHVDITFNLPIWPRATRVLVRGRELWACPPSMLIGRKLRVTRDLGRRFWRPKDVADLCLLLRHRAPDRAELGEAIERTWAPGADVLGELAHTLASPHWSSPWARRRWAAFAARHRNLPVPRDIVPVLDELRSHLRPIVPHPHP